MCPPPARSMCWARAPAGVRGADQVDGERLGPGLLPLLVARPVDRVRHEHAGVVDEHVEPAQRLRGLVHHSPHASASPRSAPTTTWPSPSKRARHLRARSPRWRCSAPDPVALGGEGRGDGRADPRERRHEEPRGPGRVHRSTRSIATTSSASNSADPASPQPTTSPLGRMATGSRTRPSRSRIRTWWTPTRPPATRRPWRVPSRAAEPGQASAAPSQASRRPRNSSTSSISYVWSCLMEPRRRARRRPWRRWPVPELR